MKKTIIAIFALLFLSLGTYKAYAQTKSPSPTPSTDTTIRDSVIKKVGEALNRPKAALGTVTDDTDSTIQIKSLNGEIRQISTKMVSAVVKVDKTTKEVKISDIAIGDFIVAMGFKNTNGVLDARRILITPALVPLGVDSYNAKVLQIQKDTISVSSFPNQQELILQISINTKIYTLKNGTQTKIKLTDVATGDILLATGIKTGTSFDTRTILIINPQAIPSSSPTPKPTLKPKPTSTP